MSLKANGASQVRLSSAVTKNSFHRSSSAAKQQQAAAAATDTTVSKPSNANNSKQLQAGKLNKLQPAASATNISKVQTDKMVKKSGSASMSQSGKPSGSAVTILQILGFDKCYSNEIFTIKRQTS